MTSPNAGIVSQLHEVRIAYTFALHTYQDNQRWLTILLVPPRYRRRICQFDPKVSPLVLHIGLDVYMAYRIYQPVVHRLRPSRLAYPDLPGGLASPEPLDLRRRVLTPLSLLIPAFSLEIRSTIRFTPPSQQIRRSPTTTHKCEF